MIFFLFTIFVSKCVGLKGRQFYCRPRATLNLATPLVAAISRFLCLWFPMSLHNVYGWHCNAFSGHFHCVLVCFCNLVLFL